MADSSFDVVSSSTARVGNAVNQICQGIANRFTTSAAWTPLSPERWHSDGEANSASRVAAISSVLQGQAHPPRPVLKVSGLQDRRLRPSGKLFKLCLKEGIPRTRRRRFRS